MPTFLTRSFGTATGCLFRLDQEIASYTASGSRAMAAPLGTMISSGREAMPPRPLRTNSVSSEIRPSCVRLRLLTAAVSR